MAFGRGFSACPVWSAIFLNGKYRAFLRRINRGEVYRDKIGKDRSADICSADSFCCGVLFPCGTGAGSRRIFNVDMRFRLGGQDHVFNAFRRTERDRFRKKFSDNTPEARLAMYRKLEDLVLDDSEHFYSSTSWWKTSCFESYTIDGVTYSVEIEIDLNKRPGGMEVANFTCHIQE